MMITRRIFGKALAAAPVAAALGQSADVALASMQPTPAGTAVAMGQSVGGGAAYWTERAGILKTRLADLAKSRARYVAEARAGLVRLDPDLAANRSFSMSTRIAIQAERNADRAMAMERRWIETDLAEVLKNITG